MKKRLPFVMLSVSWLTGFLAVFLFSTVEVKASVKLETSIVQEISSPDFHLRIVNEKLEIPSAEIDWRLSWGLISKWIPSFLDPISFFFAPSFFQKSRALFDVKVLFIHFFHTW